MRLRVSRLPDALLVGCAIVSSAAIVRSWSSGSPKPVSAQIVEFANWQQDLQFPRILGRADAPFRMAVWMDYECPACRQFEQRVDSLRARLGDSLVVVYRYFPLPGHHLAFRAAAAAECARNQGQFEGMHRVLFRADLSGDTLAVDSLLARARISDPVAFRKCLADSSGARAVEADMAHARTIGLKYTPSIQIGNRILPGGRSAAEIVPALRAINH